MIDKYFLPQPKPKDKKAVKENLTTEVVAKKETVKKPLKSKTTLKAKTKLKAKKPLKKSTKPINKKSANKEEVTKETYDTVFARDKGQCRMKDLNCKGKLDLHHINGRGKGRTNKVDNCIMLCDHHHNGVVHKENKKYRPILNEMIRKGV